MGDYQTKYVHDPDFPLSHALAASAAVPGLVGPLRLQADNQKWSEYRDDNGQEILPKYENLHLWDGGVYDNLGVESLFKPGEGLRDGTDFLIVCDASRPLTSETRQSRWRPGYLKASMRLVDIATDQVRSLRAAHADGILQTERGDRRYLRIGLDANRLYDRSPGAGKSALTDGEVRNASRMETTLRRLTNSEFALLFRHGFEVADAMLSAYGKDAREQVPRYPFRFKAA